MSAIASRVDPASIQVSIAHPTRNDIILDSRTDRNSHTLFVRSTNDKIKDEVSKINMLIQNYKFTSLMEGCLHTFQLIDENIRIEPEQFNSHTKVDTVCYYVLLEIDHMHDERRYLKHVQDFCKQTCVHAMIFLARRILFLLLAVESKAMDQFLCLMRTVNVDVDRKRRPCRERMMKVLEQNKAVDVQIPESIMGTSIVHRNVCRKEISIMLSGFSLPSIPLI